MFAFVGKVVLLGFLGKVVTGAVEQVLKDHAPEIHEEYVRQAAEKKLIEIKNLLSRNGFTQDDLFSE